MKRSDIFIFTIILLLGVLVVYPLFMVFYGSIKSGGPFTQSAFSFQGYVRAFTEISTYTTLWTTIWLGFLRAFMCLAVAVGLAWIVTRTDTPGTKYLEVAIWMAFFLPFQPYVMSWVVLAGGKSAIINLLLMKVFPWIKSAPLDVHSYAGIIWVTILKFPSVIFLFITPAFRSMDASLEESARMSGSGTWRTVRDITLPVLTPALLGGFSFALIAVLGSFIIEMYLGFGSQIYVYSTRVYALLVHTPTDFPQGMALSTVFLIVIMSLVVLQWRVLGRRQFTTITGRGFATRPTKLGKLKYVTLAISLLYVFVAIILPLGAMIAGSLTKTLNYFGGDPWTIRHWQATLTDDRFWGTLKNSLILGGSAATLGVFVYSLLVYIVIRTKLRFRNVVDAITWLPWGAPPIVMGLGILWAFIVGLPFKFLYGTLVLLVLVHIVVFLPFGSRIMTGALHQLSKELEESSRVHGGSWFYTFRKIVIPILSPALVSSWIVLFIMSLKDLDSIIFVYGAQTMPISALIFDFWVTGWEVEKSVVVGVILSFVVLVFAILGRWIGGRMSISGEL